MSSFLDNIIENEPWDQEIMKLISEIIKVIIKLCKVYKCNLFFNK